MFKNKKNKLMAVAVMMILSMSAWQTKGMIMAPSSIALPFVKLVSWGAGKVQDSIMSSMINYAIKKGNTGVLKLLLKVCPREYVNKKDNYGCTPLYWACNNNNLEMVILLLEKGAIESINKPNNDGWTPLHTACNHDNLEMVRLLLEKGAIESINKPDDYGRTTLYWAFCNNNLEMLRLLLEKGALESINKPDNSGWTLLNLACSRNNLEMVRLLLEKGAEESINKPDDYGWATLNLACNNNNLEIGRLLLENGALESINKEYNNGGTPLYCACSSGNLEMVRLLLENGALESISMQDRVGQMPIQLANDKDIRSLLNLVILMQASTDKVMFIKNEKLKKQENFEFLVKVFRGDLIVQLAKPEAREKEQFVIGESDFNVLLKDNRLTEEEKRKIEEILDLQGAPKCKLDNLNLYDYMCQYAKGRMPKVHKAMQRLQLKECAKARYSDCAVVCDSESQISEDDLEFANGGQMIGGFTESEFEGIRSEADRIARQFVEFEASVSRSFALDEDQEGRIYKEQFEKLVRQLTEKRLKELAKSKNK